MTESTRERLLAAAVARAAQGGISAASLRQIATDLGTSHRMLIYHFGSKEGLLAAISGAVEQQQRDALAALRADPSVSPVEAALRMWERFADPALWPLERLFFDLYVQALHGKEHLKGFLDTALESWFLPTVEAQTARGMPPDEARALARLGVATTRGLLLDLLATGDRAGVDAAMRMFLDWYERVVEA
jgi:AcrR family transcriptional regulator